jgi:hypothetical protein
MKPKAIFHALVIAAAGFAPYASGALIVHQANGSTAGAACQVATSEANSPADVVAAGPLTSISGCDCHKVSQSGSPDWYTCAVQANHGK